MIDFPQFEFPFLFDDDDMFRDQVPSSSSSAAENSSSMPLPLQVPSLVDSISSSLSSSTPPVLSSSSSSSCSTLSSSSSHNKIHQDRRFLVNVPSAITALKHTVRSNQLPAQYEPAELDVVCGRGRGWYNMPGSRKLREFAKEYIPKYMASKTKLEKTLVVQSVLEGFRDHMAHQARFVKKGPAGTWVELCDDQARQKIGRVIREAVLAMKTHK